MIQELQRAQEKLRTIDSLSNCIQKVNSDKGREIAYLIHRIIEAEYLDSALAREVTVWSLEANKDIFMSI